VFQILINVLQLLLLPALQRPSKNYNLGFAPGVSSGSIGELADF
jgi:hypothetical protein